jgi:uncharacterized membrane protein YvlD (DUF360 family)
LILRQKSKFQIVFEIAVRVVLITFVFTLLAFAIGLFCGIVASVAYGTIEHIHPDMSWAYKFVAAPFGAVGLVVTFLVMLISEIRRARRPLDLSRPARTF